MRTLLLKTSDDKKWCTDSLKFSAIRHEAQYCKLPYTTTVSQSHSIYKNSVIMC